MYLGCWAKKNIFKYIIIIKLCYNNNKNMNKIKNNNKIKNKNKNKNKNNYFFRMLLVLNLLNYFSNSKKKC